MTTPQPAPLTFAKMAYLAEDPGFRARVRVAMVATAIKVGSENNDGSETSRLRRAHSANVLLDQAQWAEQYAWAVAADGSINDDSPDDAIQAMTDTRFNAMAGAPVAPPAAPVA